MRILYVVEPRQTIGGGVRATINLSTFLLNERLAEHVGLFGYWANAPMPPLPGRLACIPSPTLRPFSLRYALNLQQAVKQFNPDVVHVLGLYTALLAIALRILCGSRYRIVITVHRVTTQIRFVWAAKCLARCIASCADYVTFLTDHQRQHYAGFLGLVPKRCEVIPNVVPQKTVPDAERSTRRMALLHKTGAKHLAVYAGRLIRSKQVDVFIRTVQLVRERGVELGGVIVGDGPEDYRRELTQLVAQQAAPQTIEFTGFVPDPEAYIAAADCILFPTQREALPNLLIEGFMQGKPTVISSIPELQSLVDSERNAVVVKQHTSDAYADAIVRLLSDPTLYSQVAAGAQETYLSKYEARAVSQRYMAVYSELGQQPQRPSSGANP